jgi:hypothetical protein
LLFKKRNKEKNNNNLRNISNKHNLSNNITKTQILMFLDHQSEKAFQIYFLLNFPFAPKIKKVGLFFKSNFFAKS